MRFGVQSAGLEPRYGPYGIIEGAFDKGRTIRRYSAAALYINPPKIFGQWHLGTTIKNGSKDTLVSPGRQRCCVGGFRNADLTSFP